MCATPIHIPDELQLDYDELAFSFMQAVTNDEPHVVDCGHANSRHVTLRVFKSEYHLCIKCARPILEGVADMALS